MRRFDFRPINENHVSVVDAGLHAVPGCTSQYRIARSNSDLPEPVAAEGEIVRYPIITVADAMACGEEGIVQRYVGELVRRGGGRLVPDFSRRPDVKLETESFADLLRTVEASTGLLTAAKHASDRIWWEVVLIFYGKSVRIQRLKALLDQFRKDLFSMFHDSEKIPKKTPLAYR